MYMVGPGDLFPCTRTNVRAYKRQNVGVDCSLSIALMRMKPGSLDRIYDTQCTYVCEMIVSCLLVELWARTRWVS